ncbi:nickel/cobalt transporter, partial [Ruegeria arenilitoris]|uniref:nickel/cobalt transporter n=1 Tax=Ruegeria arenilitoris TaxID=1173585 RepID=UPI001C2BB6AF
HAIRLRGILEHEPSVSNLFLVDGQRMVEASYSLKEAQVWGVPGEIKASAAAPVQGNIVVRTQAWISNLFTTSMTSMDQGKSLATVAFALLVAFLYGVLHTLGPGHGKAVVISYFVGEGGSLRRGVGMGVRIAIVHVFSAVAAVFLLDLAIRQTTGGAPSDYRLIRLGSYALIIAIGLLMLWKSLRTIHDLRRTASTAHEHGPHHRHPNDDNTHSGCAACATAEKSSRGTDGWLATAVGIVPCTGALIVMLVGFANDLVWPALTMVSAISLGMAISMSLIGVAAIWGRAKVAQRIGSNAATHQRFESVAQVAGATCVTVVGVLLFVTSWSAPVQPLASQTGPVEKPQEKTLSALRD